MPSECMLCQCCIIPRDAYDKESKSQYTPIVRSSTSSVSLSPAGRKSFSSAGSRSVVPAAGLPPPAGRASTSSHAPVTDRMKTISVEPAVVPTEETPVVPVVAATTKAVSSEKAVSLEKAVSSEKFEPIDASDHQSSPQTAVPAVAKPSEPAPKTAKVSPSAKGKKSVYAKGQNVVKATTTVTSPSSGKKLKSPVMRSPANANATSASATGLRTKDQDKMVEVLDIRTKKWYIYAADFCREMIAIHPNDKNEIRDREAGTLVFLWMMAVHTEQSGGRNPAATAFTHFCANSQGDAAMATKAAKENKGKVEFLAKHAFLPLLNVLINETIPRDPLAFLEEIRSNGKFAMGDKTPHFAERVDWIEYFLKGSLFSSNILKKPHVMSHLSSNPRFLEKFAVALLDSRKGGDLYKSLIDSVQ